MVKKTQQQDNERVYPVYVIYGKDRRRTIDVLGEIVEKVLGGADPQMALNAYDGTEANIAEVLVDLRTLPFLSERRVVVVKDADAFVSEYRDELEKYLDKPSVSGVLVMTVESFPANTRLAKKARKVGQVFEYKPVNRRELAGYLINYAARQHQLQLDNSTAAMLVELAGEDTGLLSSEIDKIAAYMGRAAEKKRITPDIIQKLVGNNRQYNVFNVIDAMTRSDAAVAMKHLDAMMTQDREAEYSAVGAFAWHFRRLYRGRVMLEQGMRDQAITKELRIWPQPEQFMRQVRKMTIRQAASALQELMKIDLANKTGAGTVRAGLEKFIIGNAYSR